MRTPAHYDSALKRKIVTLEILSEVLYSLNKRAKNAKTAKEDYYWQSRHVPYFQRWKYHESVQRYKAKQSYYYDNKDFLIRTFLSPVQVHHVQNGGEYHNLLLFSTGSRSFHQPITDYWRQNYQLSLLRHIELEELETFGADTIKLVSNQYYTKFLDMVKSGNYIAMFDTPYTPDKEKIPAIIT